MADFPVLILDSGANVRFEMQPRTRSLVRTDPTLAAAVCVLSENRGSSRGQRSRRPRVCFASVTTSNEQQHGCSVGESLTAMR